MTTSTTTTTPISRERTLTRMRPEPQVEFPHEIHRKRQRGGAEPPRARREDQGGEETRWRRRSRQSPRAHQIAARELRRRIEGQEMRELQCQNPKS